jgi:two-component system phosphate regulon sensor histidine kinase PhoR
VASSPRPYDDEDRRVLGRLADLYAVAALRERDRRYLELVVNGLAHEVRNPLNAIQVSTEALAADLGQDPEHGPFLETITKHVDRMAGLMRELLALRRPLDKERLCHVDLPRLVSGSVALWRTVPGNQEREVRLVLPSGPPPVLPLDPDQLQQVLVNLLDNAHHHSPPGAPLEVAVRSGAGTVSLEVTDHGVGLTPAAAARLFHPFFTTRRGGTGLGLVLVRHIAELHGGTATLVGNVDGPGCTARVELPLAACPRAPSDPAA